MKDDKVSIDQLKTFDAADHLDSPEVVFAYLREFFEEGDPAMIATALRDAARAHGMPDIADKSGIAREALYKALRAGSQPRFETIAKVVQALGFRLTIAPRDTPGDLICERLRILYLQLGEDGKSDSPDWRMAHELDDRIGSKRPLDSDLGDAEALLSRYGV